MSLKSILLTIIVLLIFNTTASGEYYQYTDKNGVMHFTDNILEVPEDQRKKLNVYQSVTSSDEEPAAPKPADTPETVISEKALLIQRDELIQEYNSFLEKKQNLDKQSKDLGNKKYNEMALQLNDEILQYQKKKDEYDKRVKQYNSKIDSPDKSIPDE